MSTFSSTSQSKSSNVDTGEIVLAVSIGSDDIAIVYLAFGSLCFIIGCISLLSCCHARRLISKWIPDLKLGCRRIDGVKSHRIWIFGLQVWDLLSDIFFAFSVISNTLANDNHNLTIFALAVLSPIFIVLPYCANMYTALTLYKNLSINFNNMARLYFEEKLVFFCFLVLISGGCHASLQLVCSKMFGMHIFDCGLSKRESLQFTSQLQFSLSVLLENIPQLIIQVIYIVTLRQVDEAVIFALIASFLSILTAVFAWCVSKHIDFENQLILSLNVAFNPENINTDMRQCIQRLGYRERLGYKIATALGVYHRKIEVFSVVPTNVGCVVHFGYVMDIADDRMIENGGDININDISEKEIGRTTTTATTATTATTTTTTRTATTRTVFSIGQNIYETEEYVIVKVQQACEKESLIPTAMKDTWKLSQTPQVHYIGDHDWGFDREYVAAMGIGTGYYGPGPQSGVGSLAANKVMGNRESLVHSGAIIRHLPISYLGNHVSDDINYNGNFNTRIRKSNSNTNNNSNSNNKGRRRLTAQLLAFHDEVQKKQLGTPTIPTAQTHTVAQQLQREHDMSAHDRLDHDIVTSSIDNNNNNNNNMSNLGSINHKSSYNYNHGDIFYLTKQEISEIEHGGDMPIEYTRTQPFGVGRQLSYGPSFITRAGLALGMNSDLYAFSPPTLTMNNTNRQLTIDTFNRGHSDRDRDDVILKKTSTITDNHSHNNYNAYGIAITDRNHDEEIAMNNLSNAGPAVTTSSKYNDNIIINNSAVAINDHDKKSQHAHGNKQNLNPIRIKNQRNWKKNQSRYKTSGYSQQYHHHHQQQLQLQTQQGTIPHPHPMSRLETVASGHSTHSLDRINTMIQEDMNDAIPAPKAPKALPATSYSQDKHCYQSNQSTKTKRSKGETQSAVLNIDIKFSNQALKLNNRHKNEKNEKNENSHEQQNVIEVETQQSYDGNSIGTIAEKSKFEFKPVAISTSEMNVMGRYKQDNCNEALPRQDTQLIPNVSDENHSFETVVNDGSNHQARESVIKRDKSSLLNMFANLRSNTNPRSRKNFLKDRRNSMSSKSRMNNNFVYNNSISLLKQENKTLRRKVERFAKYIEQLIATNNTLLQQMVDLQFKYDTVKSHDTLISMSSEMDSRQNTQNNDDNDLNSHFAIDKEQNANNYNSGHTQNYSDSHSNAAVMQEIKEIKTMLNGNQTGNINTSTGMIEKYNPKLTVSIQDGLEFNHINQVKNDNDNYNNSNDNCNYDYNTNRRKLDIKKFNQRLQNLEAAEDIFGSLKIGTGNSFNTKRTSINTNINHNSKMNSHTSNLSLAGGTSNSTRYRASHYNYRVHGKNKKIGHVADPSDSVLFWDETGDAPSHQTSQALTPATSLVENDDIDTIKTFQSDTTDFAGTNGHNYNYNYNYNYKQSQKMGSNVSKEKHRKSGNLRINSSKQKNHHHHGLDKKLKINENIQMTDLRNGDVNNIDVGDDESVIIWSQTGISETEIMGRLISNAFDDNHKIDNIISRNVNLNKTDINVQAQKQSEKKNINLPGAKRQLSSGV